MQLIPWIILKCIIGYVSAVAILRYLTLPLSHIINLSLISGIVPDQLKISRVIPLFKSGNKSSFSNYRPVSVLPAFSKIFEKVFYNQLSKYLAELNILCNNQHRFRGGYSTSFGLIDRSHDVLSESIKV